MLRIQCQGCSTAAYVDCMCPALGHNPAAAGVHHPDCGMNDLGAAVTCPPGSDCCDGSDHPDQSHDQHASSCTADHSEHACPDKAACATWAGITADTRHPDYDGEAPGDCPGGHCGQGVQDCTVCRPVAIEIMPGSTTMQTVVS